MFLLSFDEQSVPKMYVDIPVSSKYFRRQIDQYVKDSIYFQEAWFKNWKIKNIAISKDHASQIGGRAFFVIFAFVISLGIGWLFWKYDFIYIPKPDSPAYKLTVGSYLTLIGLLITAPISFFIWLFRDQNFARNTENARKDTNLKDFQKLSEWAAGLHLPEDRRITTTKTVVKKDKDGAQEETTETVEVLEQAILPAGMEGVTRRTGAESLQLSAIAQLQAFMYGQYGQQFMRPAFLLLRAIWQAQVGDKIAPYQQETSKFSHATQQLNRADFATNRQQLQQIKKSVQQSLLDTINHALLQHHGAALLLFKDELPGQQFSLLDNSRPALQNLWFAGTNLSGVNLAGANLTWSHLQGANLCDSQLQGADLRRSQLQGAYLFASYLQGADLSGSYLQGAYLILSQLQGANLRRSHLQGANLSRSYLQGADLTDYEGRPENIIFCYIDHNTLFGETSKAVPQNNQKDTDYINADTIRNQWLEQGALWDDDPMLLPEHLRHRAVVNHSSEEAQ